MKRTRRLRPQTRQNGLPGDPPAKKKIRILLIDELTLVREGLRLLINSQPDMEVVAEASNGAQALEQVQAVNPDVTVLDISVPPLASLMIARALLRYYPRIKLVVLRGREESDAFRELLAKGCGYVLKESEVDELLHAIREVASGRIYLDSGVTSRTRDREADGKKGARNSLTTREEIVLRLVAWGYSNKEIANKLALSPKTIEAHKFRIGNKLGTRNRVHMVRYALRHGWLNDEAAFALSHVQVDSAR